MIQRGWKGQACDFYFGVKRKRKKKIPFPLNTQHRCLDKKYRVSVLSARISAEGSDLFPREVSRHCSPKTKDLLLCASMKEPVVAPHSRHIRRHQGWLLAPVSESVPARGDANACLRCQSHHQERGLQKKGGQRKKKRQMDAKWEWQIRQKCLSTTPAARNVVRHGEESRGDETIATMGGEKDERGQLK